MGDDTTPCQIIINEEKIWLFSCWVKIRDIIVIVKKTKNEMYTLEKIRFLYFVVWTSFTAIKTKLPVG